MSSSIRTLTACVAGMLALSACATKGALRRGLDEERTARMTADSVQRADMQREVASLRADMRDLRTDFGAKIAEVADGLMFAFPVHFGYDDATVRPADVAALNRFASVVQKHYPGARLTVEGFADAAGSARYNLALSQRRAEAVREYVAGRGIDPSLVEAVGYGESRLVRRDATRDMPGAQLNRRVVFVVETPANARRTMAARD
jgi:outer membrane protein OmpA-like peptidoglycan-associated protein